MASNPPFELEDQTDGDFFDKLVDDDDVVGVESSSKCVTGIVEEIDLVDGSEVNEVRSFANLSITEVDHGNVDPEREAGVSDGNFSGLQSMEAKEEHVSEGDVTASLVLSDSFSFANGEAVEDVVGGSKGETGLRIESSGGVKEVQWSAFSNSADHGSGGFGSYDDFLTDFGPGAVGNVNNDANVVFGNETISNAATENAYGSTALTERVTNGVDTNSVEYYENEYPGWKFDPTAGQWYQLDNTVGNATGQASLGASGGITQGNAAASEENQWADSDVNDDASAVFGNETITNAATENAYGSTAVTEPRTNGVDANSVEHYENQYPGWKFDPTTGQWYQLDNTVGNATGQESLGASGGTTQGNVAASGENQWADSDVNSSQVFFPQQNAQTTVGTVSQIGTTENLSDWSHTLQQNGEYQYPAHMIFDPQYQGWYYDTIAQEWRSLDTYHSSGQFTQSVRNQHSQDGLMEATYSHGAIGQDINGNGLQVSGSGGLDANQTYNTSVGLYNQQGSNDAQSEFAMNSGSAVSHSVGESWPSYNSNVFSSTNANLPTFSDSKGTVTSYDKTNQILDSANWAGSAGSVLQPFNHAPQQNGVVQYATEFYSNQNAAKLSQTLFPNGHHVSYVQPPSEIRSLTGRPPHALVAFGFGGKLLVMKDMSAAGFSVQGSKDAVGHSVSVLNLKEVVGLNCVSSYFQSLCHTSFPGPLVGGNATSKEVNRWIDERIAKCESMSGSEGKGEAPKMLLSLLKIVCQHYGKLRSYGADSGLKDNDPPESAVASLFASVKRNNDQFGQYSAIQKCLITLPSEAHIQATAFEVQNLLISGRKREALQCAQAGQFWGFALVLARELGDQFYADTVKQMAVSQLVSGSPLRTLCLLIAKEPEEVFSNNVMPAGNLPGAVGMPPQPAQIAGYSMLANWEENLAVITANRTENDHLVITHVGDSLWKERNDVTAAHICYLIAEADFELYSDRSRLCLIGADHWNFPRTYASPEAIQRTELFEYAKVIGNSQFVLLPLQAYKLIYAHMLAEIGRISDSLKYCQAIYKVLKAGRSPEVDMLKQLLSSLEDRIRTHQQSGYAANLAPGKIVGKLLNLFDSTAHRVVGGLPPPAPSTTLSNGHQYQSPGSKVRNSQSTMGMSSLMPSASVEPINQWAGDVTKMALHNRSISEPDIGRTPRPDQVGNSNEATSSGADVKSSGLAGTSRFGRFNFGASIFQKTVALVLKPRQGRQAKLGDSSKFYYDEKLKRWVEEGAEPPAEEPALAPPPTSMAFQTEKSDHYSKNAFNSGPSTNGGSPDPSGSTPPGGSVGIPAFPPSSNQFSARGRMSVRSRYVDTFNKGGGVSANEFQAPTIPSSQPASLSSAKFFIPSSASSNQPTFGTESGNKNDVSDSEEHKSPIPVNDPFQNLTTSPAGTIHRFPSVDNIPRQGVRSGNNPVTQSRRTASWSAIPSNAYSSSPATELKASPLSFMPGNQLSGSLQNSGSSFGDELHEVDL